jgi:hypothetical protein
MLHDSALRLEFSPRLARNERGHIEVAANWLPLLPGRAEHHRFEYSN